MKNKREIQGMIVLGISIFIAYFFTWKNFQEYRQKTNKRKEYFQKFTLQERHYKELQRQLSIMKTSIPMVEEKQEIQNSFSHLLEFEILLQKMIEKHQLKLQELGRIQKEENRISFSARVEGNIYNILMFIQDLENDARRISFSGQYCRVERIKNVYYLFDCHFMIYVEEGEYDFTDIMEDSKDKKLPFVRFSKKKIY